MNMSPKTLAGGKARHSKAEGIRKEERSVCGKNKNVNHRREPNSNPRFILWILFVFLALQSSAVLAQLMPCDKVYPPGTAPDGGCIERSLVDQIGGGHGFLVGQSGWLIRRDPFRSVRRGRQLFQRKFSRDEGFGPRVNASSTGDVRVMRALGAGMMDSCAGCHGRPRGSAGFGG